MRSKLEVADIFRRHGDTFRAAQGNRLSLDQRKVMAAIEACRTSALGGHVERCEDCGEIRVAYNSCRDRHCPKCQGLARLQWLADRRAELLPVAYFHVVFTVPSPIAAIALQNKALVYDILAVTDFPDIRLKAAIQSADEGNILLIPREGGYMVRLYVDLGEIDPNNREAFRLNTQEKVIEIAQRVLRPYTLDVRSVAWFAVYQVGQRVTDRFDDVPTDQVGSRLPRVFIAGDACHTHSAKAGQGMNVSMQDAFNLGWKLASVLEGRAKPELLHTYTTERHAIAQGLIDFDKEWSKIMASPPNDPTHPERVGVDPAELQAYFVMSGRYTAGVATHYPPTTLLTAAATHQALAKGFTIGMRFHSAPVVRLADAKPVQLGHAARADGAWRLYALALIASFVDIG